MSSMDKDRIDPCKDSIGKDSIGEDSAGKDSPSQEQPQPVQSQSLQSQPQQSQQAQKKTVIPKASEDELTAPQAVQRPNKRVKTDDPEAMDMGTD